MAIKQIKIPIKPQEVTIESIEKYLDTVYNAFSENSAKIRNQYDKYCLNHQILFKTRPYSDTKVNNIVLIPALKSLIDWKTGYVFGNPIKYAQSKSIDTDDIHYLNKYVRNACQRFVDKEVGKWAYATGVGYYFIEPKSYDFDIEVEAPYEIYCVPADTCTKVYSAFGSNKPLFDMIYTEYEEVSKESMKSKVRILDIYTSDFLYTYEKRISSEWKMVNKQQRGLYRQLPLVEKRWNTDGIGIVDMAESMQNAIDKLLSNGLDNVEDVVNEIFVYKNVNLGDTAEDQAATHRAMKRNGAVVINTPSGSDFEGDVDTLSPDKSISDIIDMFSMINSMFHSTIGVPMEVSNTNSGGTTKQGSEVANGYDSAYDRAIDDINTFIKADTELLEKIMWICKNTPGNKMDSLSPSEIEIKYSLNLTDNMLTKSQSYGTFIQTMPPAMALRYCRLSNDPEAEGKLIEEYMANNSKEILTERTVNAEGREA